MIEGQGDFQKMIEEGKIFHHDLDTITDTEIFAEEIFQITTGIVTAVKVVDQKIVKAEGVLLEIKLIVVKADREAVALGTETDLVHGQDQAHVHDLLVGLDLDLGPGREIETEVMHTYLIFARILV